MTRLLPAVLVLLVSACGSSTLSPEESAIRDFDQAQKRWAEAGVASYAFDFSRSCFCPVESTEPVRIEVRNRSVVRITSRRTNLAITPSQFASWPTVDSLFVWTRRLLDNHSYKVVAQYDSKYGFPTLLTGDIPLAVDDEIQYTAGALVPQTP
jgi:hypothetical protein